MVVFSTMVFWLDDVKMLVVLALFMLIYLLWIFWTRRLPNEPPMLPGCLPILGHARFVLGNTKKVWRIFDNMAYTLHSLKACVFMIGPYKTYVIADPDDCNTIMNTCLEKDSMSYRFSRPFLGDSLLFGPVTIWKEHRKLLNPSFNQQVLTSFLGVFNKQARRLVDILQMEVGKKSFDATDTIQQISVEAICMTTMGIDLDKDITNPEEFIKAFQSLLNSTMKRAMTPWLHSEFIFRYSSLKKQQDIWIKTFRSMSKMVIEKKKRDQLENGNITSGSRKFKTTLELLLELENVLTDQEIKDEVNLIIITGFDTTATVLLFALLLIGSYPEVQRKIYSELQEVFGHSYRDVEKHDLNLLVYLEAVLKETMRYYTLTPFLLRYIDKDVKLKNYTLRAGHDCFMLINSVHKNKAWGADVEQFKPERWLDPNGLPSNSYYAFSSGRRNCIGQKYAMMAMKTILAHLLRHYQVFGDHTKLELKIDVVLKADSGHHISIERR